MEPEALSRNLRRSQVLGRELFCDSTFVDKAPGHEIIQTQQGIAIGCADESYIQKKNLPDGRIFTGTERKPLPVCMKDRKRYTCSLEQIKTLAYILSLPVRVELPELDFPAYNTRKDIKYSPELFQLGTTRILGEIIAVGFQYRLVNLDSASEITGIDEGLQRFGKAPHEQELAQPEQQALM